MTRLYRDGFGITHIAAWDDDFEEWHLICDIDRRAVGGIDDDADDSDLPFTNCMRCLWRLAGRNRWNSDLLPYVGKTKTASLT